MLLRNPDKILNIEDFARCAVDVLQLVGITRVPLVVIVAGMLRDQRSTHH